MDDDFATTFNRLLTASGKNLTQLAAITGIDRAYLRRLSTGDKRRPSPGTVVRIWIGLVFDPALLRRDPTMVYGLTDLLLAAGMTATSTEALSG